MKSILLIVLGFILGVLITMIIETSTSVSYLHKLKESEFDNRVLRSRVTSLFNENCTLSNKIAELESALAADSNASTKDTSS